MRAKVCEVCGFVHSRLGVRFARGVLRRRVKANHLVVIVQGGAWAFRSDFWDAHAGEIRRLEITDERGARFIADREALNRFSFRRNLGQGEQVIIPRSAFTLTGARSCAANKGEQRRTVQEVAQSARPVFGVRRSW